MFYAIVYVTSTMVEHCDSINMIQTFLPSHEVTGDLLCLHIYGTRKHMQSHPASHAQAYLTLKKLSPHMQWETPEMLALMV